MKIKPFYTVCILYLFANFLYLILGLYNENIFKMEFSQFYIETSTLIFSFFLQILSLFILFLVYYFFEKKDFIERQFFENFSGFFLLIWQLFFLFSAVFFGLGVVGSENKTNQILVMISNFLSADLFYILIAPSLKSNKYFKINSIVYLVSTLVRGWVGSVLIVFFIYLCRVGYLKINIKTFCIFIFIFISILLCLPFLIDFKSSIRSSEGVEFDIKDYGNKLELAIDYLLGRFQHLGHTALLLNHADEYRKLYELNKILPYWLEGIPQNFIYKVLGNNPVLTYSNTMAVYDFGAYSSEAWNANTGLSGWLVLLREKSILLILYWILIIICFFSFIYKYGNRQLFNVVSVFMIVYLYHGWFGAFFNLILLAFIIVFLKKIKFNGGY